MSPWRAPFLKGCFLAEAEYEEEIWDDDIRLMGQAGVNTVADLINQRIDPRLRLGGRPV